MNPSTSGKYTPVVLKDLHDTLNVPLLTGYVTLQQGDQIYLLCSGARNYLKHDDSKSSIALAKCLNGNFTLDNSSKTYPFDDLLCKKMPQAEAIDSQERCNLYFSKISIGFRISKSHFIQKLELCFDSDNLRTYWSKHLLRSPDIHGDDNDTDERNFQKDFFGHVDLKKAYQNSGYDRGHLTPKSDFFTGAEKRMTFYYINTAPQKMNFNRVNWRTLEGAIRKASFGSRKHLTVYTGSTGTKSTLLNLIPVPEYFWKVIIDSTTGDGVAFVGINDIDNNSTNPCQESTDVCTELQWLKGEILSNRQSVEKGKIYCCAIGSFRRIKGLVLPEMPEFRGGLLEYL